MASWQEVLAIAGRAAEQGWIGPGGWRISRLRRKKTRRLPVPLEELLAKVPREEGPTLELEIKAPEEIPDLERTLQAGDEEEE